MRRDEPETLLDVVLDRVMKKLDYAPADLSPDDWLRYQTQFKSDYTEGQKKWKKYFQFMKDRDSKPDPE